MKTKETLSTIKILSLISIALLAIISFNCDSMETTNEVGFVTFKIVIESDMDSLTVSYSDRFTAEAMEKTINKFPWSYEYTDELSNSTKWYIKSCNDSGYAKIIFYSSGLEDGNTYNLRDSVRYYAPFNDFSIQWASEEKINYNLKMSAQAGSVKIKLGYDALWSDYRIDTLITNNTWSFTEFESPYYKYKGVVINPTTTDNCKFEFVSSGKAGRNYKSFFIPGNDTVYFQITKGSLTIIE